VARHIEASEQFDGGRDSERPVAAFFDDSRQSSERYGIVAKAAFRGVREHVANGYVGRKIRNVLANAVINVQRVPIHAYADENASERLCDSADRIRRILGRVNLVFDIRKAIAAPPGDSVVLNDDGR
jgi:hypothetical protein